MDSNNSITLSIFNSNISDSLIFNEILQRLINNQKKNNNFRDEIISLNTIVDSLATNLPSIDQFNKFLKSIHDIIVVGDTHVIAISLRVIRICLTNSNSSQSQYIETFLKHEEIHYLISICYEKEIEYFIERMQAYKLIKLLINLSGNINPFPICFVRSLVAVANQKDDQLRRISLEALRILCVSNTKVFAVSNGLNVLIDAVLDPNTSDLAESLLLSLAHALNDDNSRKHLNPFLDLRTLLSPLTDLDTDSSVDQIQRWTAAKVALVILMRTWTGIILITSDELGLPTLVSMLKDSKISVELQNIMIDAISEIFEPIIVKMPRPRKVYSPSEFISSNNEVSRSPRENAFITRYGDIPRTMSGSVLLSQLQSNKTIVTSNSNENYQTMNELTNTINNRSMIKSDSKRNKALFDFDDSNNSTKSRSYSSEVNNAINSDKLNKDKSKNVGFFSSFFRSPNSTNKRRGSFANNPSSNGNVTSSHRDSVGSIGSNIGVAPDNLTTISASSSSNSFKVNTDNEVDDDSNEPVYNLMDNYAALLCCAFIHSNIIDSLCVMSSNSNTNLADKSRILMVNILRTIAAIFPENNCSELLTLPSLIDLASKANTKIDINTYRSSKASEVLQSLADVFSITSFETKSTVSTCNNTTELQSHLSKTKSDIETQSNNQMKANFSNVSLSSINPSVNSLSITANASANNSVKPTISLSNNITTNLTNTNLTSNIPNNVSTNFTNSLLNTASNSSKGDTYANSAEFKPINSIIQEVKQMSQSRMIGLLDNKCSFKTNVNDEIDISNSSNNILQDLRLVLTNVVDKVDFNKQMEASRILGKDGKEPLKWDWYLINDMLEYSFQNSDRLSEALKTKWVRRLSGFFRCSNEDKAYYASMEWNSNNFHYLECACNLYHILVEDDIGMSFLTSDRRGVLFYDIAHEIENILQFTTTVTTNPNNQTTTQLISFQNNLKNSVFRFYSTNYTMTREYFTLLGRLTNTINGRKIIIETKILQSILSCLKFRSLDYLNRLIVTSLVFTDHGYLSKSLLQSYSNMSKELPSSLTIHVYNLLYIMLYTRPNDFINYGIDILLLFITNTEKNKFDNINDKSNKTDEIDKYLYNLLLIICNNNYILKLLINKQIIIKNATYGSLIYQKCCYLSEGINYITNQVSNQWVNKEIEEWISNKCSSYSKQIELLLSNSFQYMITNKYNDNDYLPIIPNVTIPIPISSNNYALYSLISNKSLHVSNQFVSYPIIQNPATANSSNNLSSNINLSTKKLRSLQNSIDCNTAVVDLEGIVRSPWNLEIKVTNFSNYTLNNNTNANISTNSLNDYIKIDSYIDISTLPNFITHNYISDYNRLIRVKGVILDSKNNPSYQPIAMNQMISSTLLLGNNLINRYGQIVQPINETKKEKINKSMNTSISINANLSTIANPRESFNNVTRRTSITAPNNITNNLNSTGINISSFNNTNLDENLNDTPLSFVYDSLVDWSHCKPMHRQTNYIKELGDNKFSVVIPGEPVVYIFSRTIPTSASNPANSLPNSAKTNIFTNTSSNTTSTGILNHHRRRNDAVGVQSLNNNNNIVNRLSNGYVYLIEIQYYFRIQTQQSLFVPMPRHFFGELSKSSLGCTYLTNYNIVNNLIATVRKDNNNDSLKSSAFWSLGHIGSTDYGYNLINHIDPMFIEWCISLIIHSTISNVLTNFSLRGVIFYTLGLISKSKKGSRKLLSYHWNSTLISSSLAITIPRDISILFSNDFKNEFDLVTSTSSRSSLRASNTSTEDLDISINIPKFIQSLNPILAPGSTIDIEILNLIAKLPGVVPIFKESKARLEKLKINNPDIFMNRNLYLCVLKLFDNYNFKLTIKREIVKLFHISAKVKHLESIDITTSRRTSLVK